MQKDKAQIRLHKQFDLGSHFSMSYSESITQLR